MSAHVQPDVATGIKAIRLLLVEDREAYAFLLRDMLTHHPGQGYAITTATSLTAAIERVAAAKPDVILLDLGLPDSFGFATYARMREVAPDVPIVVLTALDDEELARRTVRQGAQDFLVKEQIAPSLLNRSISYAIERAHVEGSLRDLSGQLLKMQDAERRRIARELHDVAAQRLAALSINLTLLESELPPASRTARAVMEECQNILSSCSQELRTMSYLLHAPLLDELGLPDAVRELADGFSRRSGIVVDLEIAPDWPKLDAERSEALFRILQEALTNVHRHAESRTASIRLLAEADRVALEVEDAGKGLPESLTAEGSSMPRGVGVGIMGMKERMRQLGGRLALRSTGRGTLIRASVSTKGTTL